MAYGSPCSQHVEPGLRYSKKSHLRACTRTPPKLLRSSITSSKRPLFALNQDLIHTSVNFRELSFPLLRFVAKFAVAADAAGGRGLELGRVRSS
jgi:hypothetical protein